MSGYTDTDGEYVPGYAMAAVAGTVVQCPQPEEETPSRTEDEIDRDYMRAYVRQGLYVQSNPPEEERPPGWTAQRPR